MNQRALVTGGAGFIGSHLVDRLLEEGYSVTALDNLSEGKLKNLEHLKNEKRFALQEADLKDALAVDKLVAGMDVVFHLAAHANIRTSLVDHRADLDNNLIGTLNILEAMTKHHIRDLVFASTSALIGEATIRPTPETYSGIQNSLYGASKLACVTAKAKILTKDGSKKISDIKVGDLVYTHKNNLRKVVRTFKRLYYGELVNVRLGASGGHGFSRFPTRPHPELPTNCEISATPEHPVLTEDGGWKPIGQIRVGDKVSVVANRCVSCKKLIPYWTVTCSNICLQKAFPDIRVKGGMTTRGHRSYNSILFSDPIRKEEWLRKTLRTKRMNSHEFYVSLLIKEAGGNSFKFTGNGQKVVGGFCPDFVSEELKSIIEYQGRSGAQDALLNRDQEKRLQTFRENGYSVLVLDTKNDFLHPEQAIEKIRSFIGESISIVVRTDPEFIFVPVRKVGRKRMRNPKRPLSVFNLEVEKDNSYICQGIAMHNCEGYCEAFTEFTDLRFWAFRFSNVVGERCRRGVIWDFVHKLLRNPHELEILGDGKQDKEYIYIKDCIDGIMTGYTKLDKKVNIFNLAVEDNKLVDQVADIVIGEMGLHDVKRKYTGGRRGWIGDIPVVHLDISKLKNCGWSPRFSAEEAIARTAKWTIQNPRV
jgi:nucleoside-diphosphate-sugar epimerase/very-short-patch-repair endonuclease